SALAKAELVKKQKESPAVAALAPQDRMEFEMIKQWKEKNESFRKTSSPPVKTVSLKSLRNSIAKKPADSSTHFPLQTSSTKLNVLPTAESDLGEEAQPTSATLESNRLTELREMRRSQRASVFGQSASINALKSSSSPS